LPALGSLEPRRHPASSVNNQIESEGPIAGSTGPENEDALLPTQPFGDRPSAGNFRCARRMPILRVGSGIEVFERCGIRPPSRTPRRLPISCHTLQIYRGEDRIWVTGGSPRFSPCGTLWVAPRADAG
jgi:hypothetical protein